MKHNSLWLTVCLTVLIVLIGYYKIFLGYNFFVHEDWVAVSNHTAGNKFSNGWRPDKGLGLSNFYGDPGMWHSWSLLTFWERVLPDRTLAYDSSVLILDIAVVVVWLLFIRRFFPKIDPWLAAILVPLSIFCFDACAQHYARAFISMAAGIPLCLWILFDYYRRPKWQHVYLMAFVWWAVAFSGNLWSLTQLLMIGFVFSVVYYVYHKDNAGRLAKLFLLMHALALPAVLLMGSWVFYSFGLDQMMVGYIREKSIPFEGLKFIPEFTPLISYLCGFIPFDAIPLNHDLAALNYLPYRLSVSVIFVFSFLFFLGRKAESFWEFAIKSLLIVHFVHGIFVYGKLVPAYAAVFQFLTRKTSTLFTMYLFVFSIQTLMIILFVSMVSPQNVLSINRFWRRLQVLIAVITATCYGAAIIVCMGAKLAPGFYFWITDHWIPAQLPDQVGGYSKELLSYMLSYNAHRYQELIRPQWFLFFVSSMVIAGVFIKERWLRFAAGLPKVWIAGVLIVNAVMLTWSFYPLSDQPLVWERPEVKALKFEPTDRFYFVRYFQWDKTVAGFKKKWEVANQHGPRKNMVGYQEPPGLNISGFKSFTSKAEVEFMNEAFRQSGQDYVRLYYGAHFVHSPLLDMSAVKYYYSDNVIENLPPSIVPYAQFEQLYIYKNTLAWPYYYLADRLQPLEGPLTDPKPGTAYLEKDDLLGLPDLTGAGRIKLNTFGYGTMTFDVDCRHEAFLVVADAWHPFWKAQLPSGELLKVYKTNEVFKGMHLPAGNYQLKLFFDTKPYEPGLWISLIAWILWLCGFYWAWKNRREIITG